MNLLPLRLLPGQDLRAALASASHGEGFKSAFVISGIGSLAQAHLGFAGADSETTVEGPLEILSLSGSLAENGVHLYMAVSRADGAVLGGHVAHGCVIRTTAEVLLALLPGWQLARAHDTETGYQELVVRPRPPSHG